MKCDREIYWNADRTMLLEESDKRQAFRALHKGQVLTDKVLRDTGVDYDEETEKVVLPTYDDDGQAEPEATTKTVLEMNKAELVDYLTANGLDPDGKMTKAELLELAKELSEEN